MLNKSNLRVVVIWATLGVLCTCAGIRWWLERSTTPPPFVQSATPVSVAKLPQKMSGVIPPEKVLDPVPLARESVPPLEPSPPGQESIPPAQTVLTAGNLGQVTDIKGRIEVLKLEVQEEELKQKKKALSTAAPPPSVSTAPKFPELDLPALTPPSSKSSSRPSLRNSGAVVVAVQGIDGDVRAIVRTNTGASITVRKGMSLEGGIITDISRQGVIIRKNNSVTTLPFE